MAQTYRVHARKVVAALSDNSEEPAALGAREAVRALVTRIVLTPERLPGRKLSEMRLNFKGALAGIVHLAVGAKAATAGLEFTGATAERALHEQDAALRGTNLLGAEALPQTDEEAAPGGTASGLRRKTQGSLVAGAGYNEERTGRELLLCV